MISSRSWAVPSSLGHLQRWRSSRHPQAAALVFFLSQARKRPKIDCRHDFGGLLGLGDVQ